MSNDLQITKHKLIKRGVSAEEVMKSDYYKSFTDALIKRGVSAEEVMKSDYYKSFTDALIRPLQKFYRQFKNSRVKHTKNITNTN